MSKIQYDKYYTPIDVANHYWEMVDKFIEVKNCTSIIEPSCGNGAFTHWDIKPTLLIDIKSECKDSINCDFLIYDISYEKGRLIIGNPPYGDKLKLARDFFNKSCEIADYIAFILPISQLNNTTSFYKFDLIYSEDLGLQKYSDVELHCCFNIYKRPSNGKCYDIEKQHFKGITFYRQDRKDYESITDYDIRMCYFGNGSCGKILTDTDLHYSGEYKIKIDDKHPQKKQIVDIINNTDWKSKTIGIAMKRLKQYMIFDELRKNGIEEMEEGDIFEL